MTDQELEEQFVADVQAAAARGPLKIELGIGEVVTLIAQLQLALRDPGNRGPSAVLTREIVRLMIAEVSFTDAMRLGFQRGWDPQYDAPCN